jgi:hypothetical protein
MRGLAIIMALLPGMTMAEDWRALKGPEIPTALVARDVIYADGKRQSFKADGATFYGDTIGRWRVDGDSYCSVWPPSDRWACYGVEVMGQDIRFVGADGSATEGQYVDPN